MRREGKVLGEMKRRRKRRKGNRRKGKKIREGEDFEKRENYTRRRLAESHQRKKIKRSEG